MWYILDADHDSELIAGFSTRVDKSGYQKHLENKTLKSIMNFEKVNKGDVFFTPAGRVHALGPGILLAEIQQTSDVTYRIYDWDRIDNAGMMRELHTDLALDALDFNLYDNYKTPYADRLNETVKLVESPYFTTNLIHLDKALKKDYSQLDSFVIYICTEGAFDLICDQNKFTVKLGETILLPATIETVEIYPSPETKILEVYMVI
jgi:mannose-6-phosphate isomerase